MTSNSNPKTPKFYKNSKCLHNVSSDFSPIVAYSQGLIEGVIIALEEVKQGLKEYSVSNEEIEEFIQTYSRRIDERVSKTLENLIPPTNN